MKKHWLIRAVILLLMLLVAIPSVVQAKLVSVSAGSGHVLALNDDGTVWAWGNNWYGQMGIGVIGGILSAPQKTPQKVLIDNVTAITTGGYTSFALKGDGTVWAWGLGTHGWLGYGEFESQSTPVQVKNLTGVVAIACGGSTSFALKGDGTVWAWGDNMNGECGDGTIGGSKAVPVQVKGLTGIKSLSCDGDRGTFAVKDDGTVWAWGQNTYLANDAIYGALGDASGPGVRSIPFQVEGVGDVELLSGGQDNVVYVKRDGTVWAWGINYDGAVGDGTIEKRAPDVRMPSIQLKLSDVTDASARSSHSIVLKSDGTVWVWGKYIDRRGQYDNSGLPATDKFGEPAPVRVNGLDHVVDVTAGSMCDIVLKDDGTVWGWGHNDEKELGDRKNSVEPYPVLVFKGPIAATPVPSATELPGPTPTGIPSMNDSNTSMSSTLPLSGGFDLESTGLAGIILIAGTVYLLSRRKS